METSPNTHNAKSNLALNKELLDLTLLILTASVICSSIYGVFCWVDGMPVPKSEAAKVLPGMSKAEVEALLGKPQRINNSYPHVEYWEYRKPFKSTIFKVEFHEEKVLFIGFDND